MGITDIIKNLFSSEKAIITDDGQRVVSLETILPEVEGLVLFDEPVPESASEVIDTPNTVEEVMNYVSKEELTTVIDRLIKLEQLISAVDNMGNSPSENIPKEIW